MGLACTPWRVEVILHVLLASRLALIAFTHKDGVVNAGLLLVLTWLSCLVEADYPTTAPHYKFRTAHSSGLGHGSVGFPTLLIAISHSALRGTAGITLWLSRACMMTSFIRLYTWTLSDAACAASPTTSKPAQGSHTNGHLTAGIPNGQTHQQAKPTGHSAPAASSAGSLLIRAACMGSILLCTIDTTMHASSVIPPPPGFITITMGAGSAGMLRLVCAASAVLLTLLLFLLLNSALYDILLRNLPNTFTLGEALLVSQAMSCLACLCAYTATFSWNQVLHILLLQPASETPAGASSGIYVSLLCSLVLLTAACLANLLTPGGLATGSFQRVAHAQAVLKPASFVGLVVCVACVVSMAVWTVQWLVVSARRMQLLGYWMLTLLTVLPLMMTTLRAGLLPLIVVRKGYHLLAVLLFVPGFLADPDMLSISLAVAFALLVALEVVRVGRLLPSVGLMIHRFMEGFTDSRDSGPVFLTHFTLLLGMAFPVWLATALQDSSIPSPPSGQSPAEGALLGLSGVLALGLGDTAASAVGYCVGRTPLLAGNKKTVEGTTAGFAAVMAGWCLLSAHGWIQLSVLHWLQLAVCTALASLQEAVTTQLDNLFLPLYFATCILAMGT